MIFRSRYSRSQQAGIAALVCVAQQQASARERERQQEAGAATEVLPVPHAPTIPLVQVIPTSPAAPLQWSARLRPWRGRAALRERRDMNRHQRTAIERHCRLSIEAMRSEFARPLPGGLSIVLTVNSGYE